MDLYKIILRRYSYQEIEEHLSLLINKSIINFLVIFITHYILFQSLNSNINYCAKFDRLRQGKLAYLLKNGQY